MVFTCAKCDTRSVKAFSRQSYEKGLVSAAACCYNTLRTAAIPCCLGDRCGMH